MEPSFGFFDRILRQVLCCLAPPLRFDFNISQRRKVIVYSDASFSTHRAGMGIVLLDCESGQRWVCGLEIPPWILRSRSRDPDQPARIANDSVRSPDIWRLSHERAGRALLLRQHSRYECGGTRVRAFPQLGPSVQCAAFGTGFLALHHLVRMGTKQSKLRRHSISAPRSSRARVLQGAGPVELAWGHAVPLAEQPLGAITPRRLSCAIGRDDVVSC